MNKKRNSLFLYEILIKELTKTVLEEDTKKKEEIVSLIKQSFKRGTCLHEDWKHYRALMGTKVNKPVAEKLIAEVKKTYEFIDKERLFQEQNELIKKINKMFPSNIYSNFVPNYRSMATIFQLFNSKKLPIKKRVFLEEGLINELSGVMPEEKKELQPISKLAFRSFVIKFNTSYSTLLKEQKQLLERYILSNFNEVEFKYYLHEEVGRLKDILKKSLLLQEVKTDTEMVGKTNQVLGILESYKDKNYDNQMIEEILKIQQLTKEIESDAN